MKRSTIFKFGKPSISMGHGFHGYATYNQRVAKTTLKYHGIEPNKLYVIG